MGLLKVLEYLGLSDTTLLDSSLLLESLLLWICRSTVNYECMMQFHSDLPLCSILNTMGVMVVVYVCICAHAYMCEFSSLEKTITYPHGQLGLIRR